MNYECVLKSSLTPKRKLVMITLILHECDSKVVAVEKLARLCGMSEAEIENSLRVLQDRKWIKCELAHTGSYSINFLNGETK